MRFRAAFSASNRAAWILGLTFTVGAAPLDAAAQPADPRPAPGQPAPPGLPPAPGATPPGAPTDPTTVKPPVLDVEDTMLPPPAPAKQTIATLQEALTLVESRSTELAISRQEIERSKGLSRQALAGALPSLVAQGNVVHHFIRAETPVPGTTGPLEVLRPPSPVFGASITLSQPILAPRVWYGIGTADEAVNAARLSVADQRRVLVAIAADAILTVVTTEHSSELHRVGLRSALENLELTKRRLRLGSGTALDTVRAEQDVALSRAALIAGDEAVLRAREALGLALGSSDGYGVSRNISLNDLERSARAACPPSSAASRADVLAALSSLEVSERRVTETHLAYLPTAEVSSTASYSSERQIGDSHFAWSIQGVITLPIWEGGARYGATRTAEAEVTQQRERVEAVKRQATLDNEQSRRGVEVAQRSLEVSAKTKELAIEVARLSRVAFEIGEGTSFDLVESGRRRREAELDYAVKEFDLIRAKITAILATASCEGDGSK